jgi:4-amino-4-deoxychorismate lyase
MYPFFETIRYYNGVLENLSYHQQRVDRCFAAFGIKHALQLSTIIQPKELQKDKVYKCRAKYNLEAGLQVEWEPYRIRTIHSFSFVEANGYSYPHKLTDRDWLNNALKQAGTDEIIITDQGIIKDASYANLALYNGQDWCTPINPLLLGTRRAHLIAQGILIEKEIHMSELSNYEKIKLINAMMNWEESPIVSLKPI